MAEGVFNEENLEILKKWRDDCQSRAIKFALGIADQEKGGKIAAHTDYENLDKAIKSIKYAEELLSLWPKEYQTGTVPLKGAF